MSFLFFLPLQAHAHIYENDYDENDCKSQYAVAYHKLLVGIEVMCHECILFYIPVVKILISFLNSIFSPDDNFVSTIS